VCNPPVLPPFLSTFAGLLITGALCDLAIVGSLVVGAQVGVPALVGCLAAATTFPAHLAQAYWEVLDAGDRWVTAGEVAAAPQARWAAAGVGVAWVDGCAR
jgi:hypothetical protein